MKARLVQIHLHPDHAARAGQARLRKQDDSLVTTVEQAVQYTGPTFAEGPGTADLHVVYRDGFVCVNFLDENKDRVNYDFPERSVVRVKRIA